MTTEDKVKEIKSSFRLQMDGAVAQSMRNKGLNYHLNWGVTIPRLRQMADETGNDYELAIALWKENIRECKILASMIMPPERMLQEVAEIWMEQTPTQEVAEQTAYNLYQYLDYAPRIAFRWIASDNELFQLCGFNILSRLFTRGAEPSEKGMAEFIDQALTAISGSCVAVRKAAYQSLCRMAGLSIMHKRMANAALRSIGIDGME